MHTNYYYLFSFNKNHYNFFNTQTHKKQYTYEYNLIEEEPRKNEYCVKFNNL